jgi:hypothetical protein
MPNLTVNCEELLFHKILFDYGNSVIHYITIIPLTICIVVFTRIVINSESGNNSQMFRYFLVKSIFDLISLLSIIPMTGYFCDGCGESYLWNVWYIWIFYYSYFVSVSLSNCMEIFGTLDCYLMIRNKITRLMTLKSFYSILVTFLLVHLIANIHYVLMFEIIISNENKTSYKIGKSDYYGTDYYNILNYAELIYREIVPVIILLILNGLTLCELRKVSLRKRTLMKQNNSQQLNGTAIREVEMNKVKLIFFTSFSFTILRLPYVIYEIFHEEDTFWKCYYFPLCIKLYDLSFAIQIVNYYLFNKKFRNHLKMTLQLKRINN